MRGDGRQILLMTIYPFSRVHQNIKKIQNSILTWYMLYLYERRPKLQQQKNWGRLPRLASIGGQARQTPQKLFLAILVFFHIDTQ